MTNPFEELNCKIDQLTDLVSELNRKLDGKEEKPLNIEAAAQYLDIAKQTIYHSTSKKEIPHSKRGKKLYFFKADLDQWLKSHRQQTAQDRKGGV